MNLSQRLKAAALKRFDNDKRQALRYLQDKCMFYELLSARRRGTRHHVKWREIYKAYCFAEFALQYAIDMENQFWSDLCGSADER